MTPLHKSPFSRHFNVLVFLGAWYYKSNSIIKVNLFLLYKLIMTLLAISAGISISVDFYQVMWNWEKMFWNLTYSTLVIEFLLKTVQLTTKRVPIEGLRLSLHLDADSRANEEDVLIQNSATREMRLLQLSFYGFATIFAPIWLLTRFFNFKGVLPYPMLLWIFVDLNDDVQFALIFSFLALAAIIEIILAIETELAMFGLLVQISREYRILIKDISKLNQLYTMGGIDRNNESNPVLTKLRTKLLLKQFSSRQVQLIEYTKVFEFCYNQIFLHEFLGLSILIAAIGLQFVLDSIKLSSTIIYQIGYLAITTMDLFLICWYATRLQSQCYEVGNVVYSTLWYKMETECQRDIALIIMRSQHPPKITTAKLTALGLNAFMHRISKVISWLTLCRELIAHHGSVKN